MSERPSDAPEFERTDVAPQADRWIKEHGGIEGIEESAGACIVYRLADGHLLTHWDGGNDYGREWHLRADD